MSATKLQSAHRLLSNRRQTLALLERISAEGRELTPLQRLFLYSRADTIYGGSNQVQRNVIGERALGLPKEPK